MKRILIFIIGILLSCSISAQVLHGRRVVAEATPPPPTNMLQDGTFASGTTYWGKTTDIVIADNTAYYDNVGGEGIWQTPANMITPVGTETNYRLTLTITGTSGNGIYIKLGSYDSGVNYNSYAYYTDGTQNIDFTTPASVGSGGLRISFSNQVTGSDGYVANLILYAL